jgi:hypothetical protein
MSTEDTILFRTVSDRDFLIGSVWEGTGEEIHVNRHVANQSEFGGRILSGISGMLLTIATFDPRLLDTCPSRLEWAFNGTLLEEDRLGVIGTRTADVLALEGRVDNSREGRPTSAGSVQFGELSDAEAIPGISTRGRTFTAADIDLFRGWLGSTDTPPNTLVPWPLIVLLASGLMSRSGYLGKHQMTLNRAFTWTFAGLPEIGDTIHCVYGPIHTRASATRPDLTVGRYDVAVVSSVSGDVLAKVDWTVMFR